MGHQPLLRVRQSRVPRRAHRHDRHSGAVASRASSSRTSAATSTSSGRSRSPRCGRRDNLLDSRPGRAMRALKGGLDMAEAFGVDAARLKIVVFVYAALLACISGWLYAHLQRFVNPTPFGINQGIEYLFMAVVGGAGSVWGAVLGATLITLLKEVLQDVLPKLARAAGQLRAGRVRPPDGAAAAVRARGRVAVDRAPAAEAASAAGSRAAPLPARERAPPSGRAARACATRASSSAASSRSTTSRSRSARARSSGSSGRTARARARRSR